MTKKQVQDLVKLIDKNMNSLKDIDKINKIIDIINKDNKRFTKLSSYNLTAHEINVIMSLVD